MIEFTILGEPKGKGRPRFRNTGRFVQTYTDSETTNYENLVKLSFMNEGGKKIDGEVPLVVEIDFFMSIPKSASKKKRENMIERIERPLKKIDLDNGIKIILDALNKIAYDDDKQVVEVKARKFYSDEPRAEVRILTLEEI